MTGAWDVGRRRLLLNDDFGDLWGSVSREDKNRELNGIMVAMTAMTQGWGSQTACRSRALTLKLVTVLIHLHCCHPTPFCVTEARSL